MSTPAQPRGGEEPVELRTEPFTDDQQEELVAFLRGSEWPFHGHARPDEALVRAWVAAGRFRAPANHAVWLVEGGGERVGLLVVHELDDPTPTFDLRVAAGWRGRGVGRAALRWLAGFALGERGKERVEGHTRADNLAMQRLFRACGWVREGFFRRAWPDAQGGLHDAVSYALLREDWRTGRTTPVPCRWEDEGRAAEGHGEQGRAR